MRTLLLAAGVLLLGPVGALAQDRIGPADVIRVVERVDAGSRRSIRFVVEDLTPAEVLRLQVELRRAGYDPHSRSGMLDEPTRRALSRFQAARGLEICGCVSYETVVGLGIAPEVVARVEGDAGSDWITRRTAPVVIFVPSHSTYYRDYRFSGPGVVVGHEPAVGAGQYFRDRRFPPSRVSPPRVSPSRPEHGGSRPPPPAPLGSGSRIRSGQPATGTRPAPPQP